MMGYANRPIADRLDDMGDLAEGMFRLWADARKLTVEAFGFEGRKLLYRPGMDPRLRKRPDFLCWSSAVPHTFVDPKGTSGNGIRINCDDVEVKGFWQQLHPVWFFIYDSAREQVAFANLDDVKQWAKDAPVGQFEDGGKRNSFYLIDPAKFTWNPAPEPAGFGSWTS